MLHSAHRTLNAALSSLHSECCTLFTALWMLHSLHCTLNAALSAPYYECCTLCTALSVLHSVLITLHTRLWTLHYTLKAALSNCSAACSTMYTQHSEHYTLILYTVLLKMERKMRGKDFSWWTCHKRRHHDNLANFPLASETEKETQRASVAGTPIDLMESLDSTDTVEARSHK